MSNVSLLAGFGLGECVDPQAEVRLLVELHCRTQEGCQHFAEQTHELPCQLEWQQRGADFVIYVLAAEGAGHDKLLSELARIADDSGGHVELVESRFVQALAADQGHHSFCFVSQQTSSPRDIVLKGGSHAFGSGAHPSTSLVIELLEEMAPIRGPVLDVGCGTGVLSLVAARLGAGPVLGVDIDQEAVATATANARANAVQEVVSFSSSPLSALSGGFPLILANLTASVFYRLLPDITKKAGQFSQLLVSGLQGRQADEAVTHLIPYGWQLIDRRRAGKWHALRLQRC